VGGAVRLGVPITEHLSVGFRYSLYRTEIKIPNDTRRPFNDCTFPIPGLTPIPGTLPPGLDPAIAPSVPPAPPNNGTNYNCLTNGEASLAIKEAAGTRITSMPGMSLVYSTLDNARNPTQGIYAELRADVAGLGGNAKFARGSFDARYYYPIWDDVVGFVRAQGGHVASFGGDKLRVIDNFNIGSSLVRGFAPNGLGPRDISPGVDTRTSGLGGTTYFGATAEVQFPIFGLPKEVGLKGAVFADAGTLFGYSGRTNFWDVAGVGNATTCVPPASNGQAFYAPGNCIQVRSSTQIRTSVGVGLLWASPMGPIRFDYAWAITKDRYDVEQRFRFTGGGTF